MVHLQEEEASGKNVYGGSSSHSHVARTALRTESLSQMHPNSLGLLLRRVNNSLRASHLRNTLRFLFLRIPLNSRPEQRLSFDMSIHALTQIRYRSRINRVQSQSTPKPKRYIPPIPIPKARSTPETEADPQHSTPKLIQDTRTEIGDLETLISILCDPCWRVVEKVLLELKDSWEGPNLVWFGEVIAGKGHRAFRKMFVRSRRSVQGN